MSCQLPPSKKTGKWRLGIEAYRETEHCLRHDLQQVQNLINSFSFFYFLFLEKNPNKLQSLSHYYRRLFQGAIFEHLYKGQVQHMPRAQ